MDDVHQSIERYVASIRSRPPTEQDLSTLCNLLEKYDASADNRMRGNVVKQFALDIVQRMNTTSLQSHENMLRLYAIVGKYSGNLGPHGIFDKCEERRFFCDSPKFHVVWAESHAKKKHLQKFREILELARMRIQDNDMESRFRSIADKYFPNNDIFPREEISGLPDDKRSRRRQSEVALIQDVAREHASKQPVGSLGKGVLMIKLEFIDKVGYTAISFEEMHCATWNDDNYDVVDMDISAAPESPKIMQEEPVCMEKRKLLASPQIQVQPKQSRIENRLFESRPMKVAESLVSFRENEYNKANAVFSDTVNLGTTEPKDATMPIEQKPVEAFEVFEDQENTINDLTLAGNIFGVPKKSTGIVTSTPAAHTHVGSIITDDDFFSSFNKNNVINVDDASEGFGFNKKRKSLALKGTNQKQDVHSQMAKVSLEDEPEDDILERTGISRPRETMSGDVNPWDNKIRQTIMRKVETPINQHDYQTVSPKIHRNKELTLGGMKFSVMDLVGEGGFAKVFKCMDEEKNYVALKYEIPSCAWEVYICNQLRNRLLSGDSSSSQRTVNCVMEITDAFIYSNASILINDFLNFGTLLEISNKLHGSAHSQLILFVAIHIATILRNVHRCQIIHGDVKPDNIMILGRIDENWDVETLLNAPLFKFIDWGRSIDMKALPKGTTFQGRAGTACFDCPEMMTGKLWNYHTDYFGFIATLHVFIFGKYCNLILGSPNSMSESLKRRLSCRDLLGDIFHQMLNIESPFELPDWNQCIMDLKNMFRQEFDAFEWRNAARMFNSNLSE